MKSKIIAVVLSISTLMLCMPSGNALADTSASENSQEYILYSKDLVTGEEGFERIPISDDIVEESMSGNIFEGNNSGGISPNAYIGEDESYEILDTYNMPYKAVCNLVTHWDKNGDGISDYTAGGTGCMVGRKVLLTAGHLIYKHDGTKCVGIDVYPSQQRYYTPYSYKAKKIFANPRYEESFSNGKDWGIIILNGYAGDKTGWLDATNCNNVDMIGEEVSVIGYPGGKDQNRVTMWRSDGKVVGQGNNFLRYDCDSTNGNSGSPVINSNNQIVAVHSGGTENVSNVGAKVINDLYGTISYMRWTYD